VTEHAARVRSVPKVTSENRKSEQRRLFFEDTQLPSEALPGRIRDFREQRGLTDKALAGAMSEVGVALTEDQVSKIERRRRRVTIDELFAFADVLKVPLSRLLAPRLGDRPIRAGGVGLEYHELGNWMVAGDPKGLANFRLRERIGLAREIATLAQVLADEKDPAQRDVHARELIRAVDRLRKSMGIKPGVMNRQAMRDEMEKTSER
jgi:transcriptional regulator with XRE-family HTH domain